MHRFTLFSFLLFSLLFVAACGNDDDNAGADLTIDAVGTYDGQYLYQVPGEPPITDATSATVTRVDNETIRIQFPADGIDFDFQATLTDQSTFSNSAITVDGDAGYSVTGTFTSGILSLSIGDDLEPDIEETFVGQRR